MIYFNDLIWQVEISIIFFFKVLLPRNVKVSKKINKLSRFLKNFELLRGINFKHKWIDALFKNFNLFLFRKFKLTTGRPRIYYPGRIELLFFSGRYIRETMYNKVFFSTISGPFYYNLDRDIVPRNRFFFIFSRFFLDLANL